MARSPFQGYIQMLLLLRRSPISYPNRCNPESAKSLGLSLFTAAAQVSRNTTSALWTASSKLPSNPGCFDAAPYGFKVGKNPLPPSPGHRADMP